MKLEEIVEKIKKIHEFSCHISKYENMIKELPDRKNEIQKWIDDETKLIKDIQDEIADPLVEKYKNDVVGKYFCNICTWSTDHDYIMLTHVDDTFLEKKSVYHKYDMICKQLGEFLYISMTKEGDIIETDYTKLTSMFDFKGGYLSSHNLYGILSEGLNGWKEIDKNTYEKIVSKYRNTPLTPKYNLNTLNNFCKDVVVTND